MFRAGPSTGPAGGASADALDTRHPAEAGDVARQGAGGLDARLVQCGPHIDRAQAWQPAGKVDIKETTPGPR